MIVRMGHARKSYTIKQLSNLAGVTVRTLHYYDEIGLLQPESYGQNGYRHYGEAELQKLQQILFFRELDFPLAEIKKILDRPDFDMLDALQVHRARLEGRVERLQQLIHTVDKTMGHLTGEIMMTNEEYYQGFDEEQQKEYEQYIRERYGDEPLNTSIKRWAKLTPAEKQAFLEKLNYLHQDIAAKMDKGAGSPEIQALIQKYREQLSFFYDITLERYEALGHMYNANPEFKANYESVRPGMAAFMEKAIEHYVEANRD